VTFFGVPVLPPTTTGLRVFRITNVRIDATPLNTAIGGATQVQAQIAISGATSLAISNASPVVGFVTPGLAASAAGATNLNQCSTQTKTAVNVLTFTENFGTAFKTRVAAQSNSPYAGQLGNLPQNTPPYPNNNGNQAVPGAIYNSESNFVFPVSTPSSSGNAGLADFGTRLKATFNNIPSGVRVFVSTSNVNNAAYPVTTPTVIGGNVANTVGTGSATGPYIGYAQLINGENTSDGNAGVSGFFPAVSPTDNGPNNGNVPIAEVSIDPTSKSGVAVWEAVNTNPNTPESFKFAVYITYTAAVASNSPLPGGSSVSLSFAATASSGVASSSASIPRFASSSTTSTIFNINICRTVLLYPFITNQGGFDTGLSIANTSSDSIVPTTNASSVSAQSGNCRLTYFSAATPPPPTDTGAIAAGTVWVNTVAAIAPNFQGYMFAVCNFQYAHGFAFISDLGARNLAMGYLALIIPDPGTGSRPASPGGCIGVSGCNSGGEQDSH
jgi:hypothetical protein